MPLFDVHFNRPVGSAAIEQGRVVVEADDRNAAADMVLHRFALSPSNTKVIAEDVPDDMVPIMRKQVARPPDVIEPRTLRPTKQQKKEREMDKAWAQLEKRRKPDNAMNGSSQLLKKYLCTATAIAPALNDDHALRLFAEELMSRAQCLNKLTSVTSVSVSISLIADQRGIR